MFIGLTIVGLVGLLILVIVKGRARQSNGPPSGELQTAAPGTGIDGRALIAGIFGTITVFGALFIIGLIIYNLIKGNRRAAAGFALGLGIVILVGGITCFAISAGTPPTP